MYANDEIISVENFQKKIHRYQQCYDEIYFRGEVKEFLKREPSILRGDGYIEYEGELYQDMMQMYNSQMSNAYSYIGKLALLQHNNVPTRLLDITSNPLIALYFACEQNGNADDEDGYVFMYIRKGKGCHSPEVYILSLHACFPNLTNEKIVDEVWQEFGISYTEEQVKTIIHTPIFLKKSDDLNVGNDRIRAQDGCFFICADGENDGLITLDAIPPVSVFRIPAMYKETIRAELDQKGINVCSIYPEMPSGGTYLKAKYGKMDYQVSDMDYEIYEVSQKTHCRRDTDLRIIVKKHLAVSSVKKIVRYVCDSYKDSSDVIWVYVGLTKEDMICCNWTIMARWINPLWKNTGITHFEDRDGEFSWQSVSGATIMSDYNEANVFKAEEELYVYYHHLLMDSTPYIRELFLLYDNEQQDELYIWTSKNKEIIRGFFGKSTNGYRSRHQEWDDFIKHYDSLYTDLDNVCMWAEREDLCTQVKWHEIGNCVRRIRDEWDFIAKGETSWRETLKLTDTELELCEQNYERKNIYSFVQTIPISENAMEVTLEIDCKKNNEGKVIVLGRTNLFDGAQLMISIIPYGKNVGPSCKVNCLKGAFMSKPLGNGKNVSGKCTIKIVMPISSVQPIEFVKKAGMQYENLTGNFIKRDGISPLGRYEQEVVL